MATGQRVDPYANFNFLVEIDGITQAGFRECSGIDSSIEIHEFRQGGDNLTSRKLPMKAKYTNITLKWGLTDNHDLYDWHRQALDGNVQRKNGSIVVLDRQGKEQVRWNFFAAWPSKYDGASLNAEGNDVAIETLELAHERLERVK
jgi:phage tail-like protein